MFLVVSSTLLGRQPGKRTNHPCLTPQVRPRYHSRRLWRDHSSFHPWTPPPFRCWFSAYYSPRCRDSYSDASLASYGRWWKVITRRERKDEVVIMQGRPQRTPAKNVGLLPSNRQANAHLKSQVPLRSVQSVQSQVLRHPMVSVEVREHNAIEPLENGFPIGGGRF